ncbi:MAG: rRNA maturation RNase YbeY [Cellulophaga sp.]
MINYNYEVDFKLTEESKYTDWVDLVISKEAHELGEITFIFCTDEYLLKINQNYLKHDTYTDIITFDYTENRTVSADVFISLDRVRENAVKFKITSDQEMLRVMVHGVLHLLGYKDKTTSDTEMMREKEEEMMQLFHVEP